MFLLTLFIMALTTFLHINIRGIRGSKEELIQLLNKKNVFVASINETLLSTKSQIQIPGYNIIEKNGRQDMEEE